MKTCTTSIKSRVAQVMAIAILSAAAASAQVSTPTVKVGPPKVKDSNIQGVTADGTIYGYYKAGKHYPGYIEQGGVCTDIVPTTNANSGVDIYGVVGNITYGYYYIGSDTYAFTFDGSKYATIVPEAGATNIAINFVQGRTIYGSYDDTNGFSHLFSYNGFKYSLSTPETGAKSLVLNAVDGVNQYGNYYDSNNVNYLFSYDGTNYVTSTPEAGASNVVVQFASGSTLYGSFTDTNNATFMFNLVGTNETVAALPTNALNPSPVGSIGSVFYGLYSTNDVGFSIGVPFSYDGTNVTPIVPAPGAKNTEITVAGNTVYGTYNDSNNIATGFLLSGTNYTTVPLNAGTNQVGVYGGQGDVLYVAYNGRKNHWYALAATPKTCMTIAVGSDANNTFIESIANGIVYANTGYHGFHTVALKQTIDFPLPKTVHMGGNNFFTLVAKAPGGPVGFVSSDSKVIVLSGDFAILAGPGKVVITASQSGGGIYAPASVSKTIIVKP